MPEQGIPLTRLIPDAAQPRVSMHDVSMQMLTASIRKQGLLLPLRVKPADSNGLHVIISGHRRFLSLQSLGCTEAPCIIVTAPLDEATVLAEQLAENIFRESLSPLEEAQSYRRYLTLKNVTASQAAQELAVSSTRISRALALLELPKNIQDAIHTGKLSADTGYHLSRLPDGVVCEQLLAQALAGTLFRDAAVRAVKASQVEATDVVSVSRASLKLPADYTLTLSGPAVHLDVFISSLEDVLKEARKARTQGYDLSTLTKMFRDRSVKGGAS
jgi:ParB family transcriptional regulator, chromosome partitioning protein